MASGAEVRKLPVGPLIHRCSPCQATGPELQRCTGCKVVRYCSREHRLADIDGHMQTCNQIMMARALLDVEDNHLRKANPDYQTPANAFETAVSYFWETPSTRPYMRARLALVREHLLPLGTLDSVQEAHDHLRDMLRLCHRDTMAVREILPCIMLRLDMDQECYDFVKWWATCDVDYDWGDFTLPYLDIYGADAFEEPDCFINKSPSLNYVVAVMILKFKLLVDVLNTKVTRKLLARRSIPNELHVRIEQAVVRSPLSANLYKLSYKALSAIEETLVLQIFQLGMATIELNPHFMYVLFDPDVALAQPHYASSPCPIEGSYRAIQYSYATWWSTEGVLGLLDSARDCAVRAAKGEVEELIARETWRKIVRSRIKAEEVLADISVNRLWEYLDHAVMDATYLGPWSERPSEVEIRRDAERELELIMHLNGNARASASRVTNKPSCSG